MGARGGASQVDSAARGKQEALCLLVMEILTAYALFCALVGGLGVLAYKQPQIQQQVLLAADSVSVALPAVQDGSSQSFVGARRLRIVSGY